MHVCLRQSLYQCSLRSRRVAEILLSPRLASGAPEDGGAGGPAQGGMQHRARVQRGSESDAPAAPHAARERRRWKARRALGHLGGAHQGCTKKQVARVPRLLQRERKGEKAEGGGARALTSPRNCRCTAPRTSGAPAGRRSAPGRPAARRRGCTCHELSHDRRELLRQAILGARLVIGTLRHKTCKLRQQLERAAFRVGFLARGPEAEDQGAPHVLEATDAALLPQEADLLPRLELNPCRLHELLEDILDLILLLGRGTVIGGQQRVAGRLVQPPDAQEGQRDGLVTAGHGYRRGWLGRAGAAAHMA
ncbi:unnamed protein product, partial [Prorocentrum cordatum]